MTQTTKPTRKPAYELTWEKRMEAAQLNRLADALLSIPFSPGPKPDHPLYHPRRDEPLRPLSLLADSDRWAIADLLYRLAQPDALKALTTVLQPSDRRGPKPKTDDIRKMRAALEYELRPKQAKQTARAWSTSDKRLSDWHKKFNEEGCAPGSWRYWAAVQLRTFRATHRNIFPHRRRAAFVRYLRSFR